MEKIFGLIGATVSHSFSKSYFDEKFFREGLRDYHYELFPLSQIQDIEKLLKDNKALSGLNVTLPYKEQVLKYLNEIDPAAKVIGAVNVIKVENGKLKGYNTDSDAFYETIEKWLPKDKTFNALILGSGGSSKAVRQALTKLNYPVQDCFPRQSEWRLLVRRNKRERKRDTSIQSDHQYHPARNAS
jgi:shikimate dehydrogenase